MSKQDVMETYWLIPNYHCATLQTFQPQWDTMAMHQLYTSLCLNHQARHTSVQNTGSQDFRGTRSFEKPARYLSVFSQLVHDLSSNLKSMPLAMKIHFLKAHSGWIWSSDKGLKNHMWPRNHRLQPPDLRERFHGRSQVFCITLHHFMLSNQNIFPFSYNAWNNVKNPLWVFSPL